MMLKPSSSKCNLNCKYCFNNYIAEARNIKNYGFMKDEVLEEIVVKSIQYSSGGVVTMGFQGGEPTLIGLDYYKKLIKYIEKHNSNNTKFNFVIQTNGTLLNEDWARFFKENKFLVGISLDGTKMIHNLNRIDYNNDGTYNDVMKGIRILKKFNVDYNILTVVTSMLSRKINSIYRFFKKNDFRYLQFIPCLDPIEIENKNYGKYSLSGEEYGDFLNILFDMWYEDIKSGKQISIRYFDNLINFLLGFEYEACNMGGICSCQNIIEADGSMYPCDFYTYEKYKIGNIMVNTFDELFESNSLKKFINYSIKNIDNECLKCKYRRICNGGCRRYRENQYNNKNVLCDGFKSFLDRNLNRLREIALLYYVH